MTETSSTDLIEAGDRWRLPLPGLQVTRCCVDYAVTLTFGAGDSAFYVTIEQPFLFKAASIADEERLVPEGPPRELGPVLAVVREPISEAVAYKDGRLKLEFANGCTLRVPVSDDFEAWNLVGPSELRVVSLPGGDLAVWRPEAEPGLGSQS